jgi:hypothetical protein
MTVQPTEWNVVIVGRWNRAILTPGGIGKRLFGLGEGKLVEVAVPLDGVSPYLVKHPEQQILVMTDESRLLIQAAKPDYETLSHAMAAGFNALSNLPETPVTAAGFNLSFASKEVDPEMASLLVCGSETAIVDVGFNVVGRSLSRSLQYEGGRLNVTMVSGDEGFNLTLNFHRGSERVDDLKTWLQTPVSQVEEAANKVVRALGLDIQEVRDDTNAG